MPRYVIERDIPYIGSAEREALRDAAHKSNSVLAEMKAENKNIQWDHTYVAGDKTFCIYIADNEALIHEHAQRSGFSDMNVTEVRPVVAAHRDRHTNRDLSTKKLSLYFDLAHFSPHDIAEVISFLSELYEDLGGDRLIIDDMKMLETSPALVPEEV